MSFKGKVALVTGSTSGIGLAIARAFAGQGAHVCINGFGDAGAIEKERSGIEAEFGVKAIYSGADMSKGQETEAMVADTIKQLGAVDILVNNAGIQFVSPVEDFPPEKWDQIIAINLSSAFHATRAAVPGMKAKKWGRIINTASAHALVASPFKSAYVAAKHGLVGLTKVAALEAAESGVTCNAVCPGYVWTPLVAGQVAQQAVAHGLSEEEVVRKVFLAEQPNRRFATIEEIAGTVAFLCSPAAASITGIALPVDGGWTAH